MAVSPLAILTPVGNFRSGAAFASQIALTSVEAIHLHEGCHILGRNVFLPEKVPHVSRQHLKLDVRPGEIEITVVRSGLHVIQWNVTLCNHSSGATAGAAKLVCLTDGLPNGFNLPYKSKLTAVLRLTNAGI